MYVYREIDGSYHVGYFSGALKEGAFVIESSFDNPVDAAARVSFLNGCNNSDHEARIQEYASKRPVTFLESKLLEEITELQLAFWHQKNKGRNSSEFLTELAHVELAIAFFRSRLQAEQNTVIEAEKELKLGQCEDRLKRDIKRATLDNNTDELSLYDILQAYFKNEEDKHA